MIKVIMNGCNGQMGRVISDLCAAEEDTTIVAGVDINTEKNYDYPVYEAITDCSEAADVVIDFSTASCVDGVIAHCVENRIPLVLCTTGLSDDQEEVVREAAREVAVLQSANMSLGINTLIELLKPAARALAGAGFDIEILEKHHNRKLDAPSGTALALADAVNEAMNDAYDYKFDRSSERKQRGKYEIGIQSIRGGNIVGEHEVMFCGTDEIVSLKHVANSRSIFAKGAIAAAHFLAGKPAGLYDMGDVIRG
ncbi:MAG: 4-hydroxy-tetrahydrodipicolinate reductase [Lachnospiraceae bacterium]|nr:4-hydroxy-tetrahydrodipicolinate reductase [Lachnospiraceae bacterium]